MILWFDSGSESLRVWTSAPNCHRSKESECPEPTDSIDRKRSHREQTLTTGDTNETQRDAEDRDKQETNDSTSLNANEEGAGLANKQRVGGVKANEDGGGGVNDQRVGGAPLTSRRRTQRSSSFLFHLVMSSSGAVKGNRTVHKKRSLDRCLQSDSVQRWLEDLRHMTEVECMCVLQAKPLGVDEEELLVSSGGAWPARSNLQTLLRRALVVSTELGRMFSRVEKRTMATDAQHGHESRESSTIYEKILLEKSHELTSITENDDQTFLKSSRESIHQILTELSQDFSSMIDLALANEIRRSISSLLSLTQDGPSSAASSPRPDLRHSWVFLNYLKIVNSISVCCSNAVQILVQASRDRTRVDTPYSKDQVVTILANLSVLEQCSQELLQEQGVERLLVFLSERPSSSSPSEGAACERVQQKAAVTLARLSRDADFAHNAIKLNAVPRLIELCRSPTERNNSDSVLVACLAALRRLASEPFHTELPPKDRIKDPDWTGTGPKPDSDPPETRDQPRVKTSSRSSCSRDKRPGLDQDWTKAGLRPPLTAPSETSLRSETKDPDRTRTGPKPDSDPPSQPPPPQRPASGQILKTGSSSSTNYKSCPKENVTVPPGQTIKAVQKNKENVTVPPGQTIKAVQKNKENVTSSTRTNYKSCPKEQRERQTIKAVQKNKENVTVPPGQTIKAVQKNNENVTVPPGQTIKAVQKNKENVTVPPGQTIKAVQKNKENVTVPPGQTIKAVQKNKENVTSSTGQTIKAVQKNKENVTSSTRTNYKSCPKEQRERDCSTRTNYKSCPKEQRERDCSTRTNYKSCPKEQRDVTSSTRTNYKSCPKEQRERDQFHQDKL
ncbi:hypothetical protein WMY93_031589 [Mugilogobius chulae]|uniref:Uncharacterized protein n=1 Tax=Mugilogobius chulae TaxID=88201 RepID=A0AAW0MD56_9GOBI